MGIKSKDELYRLYGENQFADLKIDETTDPELFKFVENKRL